MSRPCLVAIDNDGSTFTCDGESVLDAAIANGIDVPYNCRGGACGTCKAQVIEGAVQHGWTMGFAITDEEIASGLCLICSSKPQTERLVLRMVNTRARDHARSPIAPANYDGEVLAANRLTRSVLQLKVRLPKVAGFRFEPGMYMDVHADGIARARPYSIANPAGPDGTAPDSMLEFLVARHDQGPVSQWLYESVNVGDTLRMRGPFGTFGLPHDLDRPILMLAGGTGLAPLLSMTRRLLEAGHSRPVELLFSVRTMCDAFCIDELHRLADRHANFRYRLFLTRPPEGARAAPWAPSRIPDHLARGPIDPDVLIFAAGSPGFVGECSDSAVKSGVRSDSIISEAYVRTDSH